MKHYVIHLKHGFVEHEGDKESCETYVRNAQSLFNAGPFLVTHGMPDTNAALNRIKDKKPRF